MTTVTSALTMAEIVRRSYVVITYDSMRFVIKHEICFALSDECKMT